MLSGVLGPKVRLRKYPHNLIRVMPAQGEFQFIVFGAFFRTGSAPDCKSNFRTRTAFPFHFKILKMRRIAFFLGMIPFFANAQQVDTTELLSVEVRAVRAAPTAPFAKTNLSKADIEK